MNKTKTILNSAIVLYFVIGLEILIIGSKMNANIYMRYRPFLRWL